MAVVALSTHSRPASVGRRIRWRSAAPLAALLLLAGCAGAKVDNLSTSALHAPATPATLQVQVRLAPDLDADAKAGKAAHALEESLIKRYRDAGLMALVYTGERPARGSVLVQVRVGRADPGNRMARLLVGFGAGRSVLDTEASILIDGEDAPAMTFSASAKSGRKPGLILPGGIAAATGDVSRLAIGGGIGLALEPRSSLSHDTDRSAKAIVKQTRDLYRLSNWHWPDV